MSSAIVVGIAALAQIAGDQQAIGANLLWPLQGARSAESRRAPQPSLGESEEQKKLKARPQLDKKLQELRSLEDRATTVTLEMGKLASSGKLAQDSQAIERMQQMVDELRAIRTRLDSMQQEIEAMRAWIEGRSKELPELKRDVAQLKAHKESGYVQFQYQDTDRNGGPSDAFRMRRVRLGFSDQIAPNASMKVSFDLATGTNQLNAQLKDAFLTYNLSPGGPTTQAILGQQNFPLGYEIERSSSRREFPERAQYNQLMFNGERGRGVQVRHQVSKNAQVHIGVWDALSITDPEQANLAPGPENRLAATAGVRFTGKNFEAGVSGLMGRRPSFNSGGATSPRANRQFLYLDGMVNRFPTPQAFLRGELMLGRDRVPSANGNPQSGDNPMRGYHLILGYNLNASNVLSFKYEEFDPNLSTGDNLLRGYGVAFNHLFNPATKLTLAYEAFQDDARAGAPFRQRRYNMTTLRMQFSF